MVIYVEDIYLDFFYIVLKKDTNPNNFYDSNELSQYIEHILSGQLLHLNGTGYVIKLHGDVTKSLFTKWLKSIENHNNQTCGQNLKKKKNLIPEIRKARNDIKSFWC